MATEMAKRGVQVGSPESIAVGRHLLEALTGVLYNTIHLHAIYNTLHYTYVYIIHYTYTYTLYII